MRSEKAYGVIGVRRVNGRLLTLLVKHQKGHWSFPKGRPEVGETPQVTASREVLEETGVSVKQFLDLAPIEDSYVFEVEGTKISKTVVYFLAILEEALPKPQEKEIMECAWLDFEEALAIITFQRTKDVCRIAYLKLQMAREL